MVAGRIAALEVDWSNQVAQETDAFYERLDAKRQRNQEAEAAVQARLDTSYLEMDEMNARLDTMMNKMSTLGTAASTEANPKKIKKINEEIEKVDKEI